MHSEPKAEEEHIAPEDYKKSDIVFGWFGAQNDVSKVGCKNVCNITHINNLVLWYPLKLDQFEFVLALNITFHS